LTVHLDIIFVNNQLDTNSFLCIFISSLYIIRAAMWPSSGELIVSVRHMVYVILYRHRFDTLNSPDDGHMAARSM